MIATMQEEKTVSAQEKWAVSDKFTRENMLLLIGWSPSYAAFSWKKLPHMVKVNLTGKPWTTK